MSNKCDHKTWIDMLRQIGFKTHEIFGGSVTVKFICNLCGKEFYLNNPKGGENGKV